MLNPDAEYSEEEIRHESILYPDTDLLLHELEHGVQKGESCGIEAMDHVFKWKKGFVNCWTGFPNMGKSTFFLFLAVVNAVKFGRKFLIWSPEMISSIRDNTGKVEINANDLFHEVIFMMTGRSPYMHYEETYRIPRIDSETYLESINYLKEYIHIINPKDRSLEALFSEFQKAQDLYGYYGWLVDPFMKIKTDEHFKRTDIALDEVFAFAKEKAVYNDISLNFIAHPKANIDATDSNGNYKLCTQYDLLGGASWDNNMDGIYSIYRSKKSDNSVKFFNLKQRKQALTTKTGVCGSNDDSDSTGIQFDWQTNRYYFKSQMSDEYRCPIDGQLLGEYPWHQREKRLSESDYNRFNGYSQQEQLSNFENEGKSDFPEEAEEPF